jgi:hypothetical protein
MLQLRLKRHQGYKSDPTIRFIADHDAVKHVSDALKQLLRWRTSAWYVTCAQAILHGRDRHFPPVEYAGRQRRISIALLKDLDKMLRLASLWKRFCNAFKLNWCLVTARSV